LTVSAAPQPIFALLADENFNQHIVRALRLHPPAVDLVRAQDVGLGAATDPAVLAWAAVHQRVLLTHDFQTVPGFAFDRVNAGAFMAGVIAVQQHTATKLAAEQILMIISCSTTEEVVGHVLNVPF
jgi:hypothetical protein